MEADVRDAAFTAVSTLANGLGLAVYWPNVAVPDDTADEHIRVSVISTQPDSTNICSAESRYQWILQLSIYVRDGVGEILPAQHADNVKSGLPFGTVLSGGGHEFRVNRTAEVFSAINYDAWLVVPVQFRLETIG